MSYTPIFIITLKRTPERLLNIRRQLDALNLSYQVVYAIDEYDLQSKPYRLKIARQLDIPESIIENLYKNRPKYFSLATLFSHIQVYDLMIKNQIPTACILEDDIEISPIFPNILTTSQNFFWDILLLAHQSKASGRLVNILLDHLKPKAVIFKIFNALINYKKTYRQQPLYDAHRIRVIIRCFFDIVERYLRRCDSYEKIMLKFFHRKWIFEKHQYTRGAFWEYYACVMGALPGGNKSSRHHVLRGHYLVEPYEYPYSAMAYMLNLSAARKWRGQALSGHFASIDIVLGNLSVEDRPKFFILSPPCATPVYRYLYYSVRRAVGSLRR